MAKIKKKRQKNNKATKQQQQITRREMMMNSRGYDDVNKDSQIRRNVSHNNERQVIIFFIS